jgi:hypothetical protein
MKIKEQLEANDAPFKVVEAGEIIDRYQQAGLRPPADVVEYVRNWVNSARGNDRYGK